MANPGYVRSTDGDNADNGSTWALANATLSAAMSDQTAGDRVWVSDNHAESTAGSTAITLPGTLASPVSIICGDDAAEPPTAVATTGTVTTTGTASLSLNGVGYIRGLSFSAGTGAGTSNISLSNADDSRLVFDTCNFTLAGSATAARIILGAANLSGCSAVTLNNCGIRFGQSAQLLGVSACRAVIRGGSALSGGTTPASFIALNVSSGESLDLFIDGFDMSNWGTSINITNGVSNQAGRVVLRNVKVASGWSGSLCATPITTPGMRVEAWNLSDGDVNYAMWIEDCGGSIRHETSITRASGASDGDTAISWKMVSSSGCAFFGFQLVAPEIYVRNSTVGSAQTYTVEIVHDSATALKEEDIWLEALYLGTSGSPISSHTHDGPADVFDMGASGDNQDTSSVTWNNTGGFSNVNKQKLSVTFTPQEKGVVVLRVRLAKPSYTVYVCPKVDVS